MVGFVVCEDGATRRVVPEGFVSGALLWDMWRNHRDFALEAARNAAGKACRDPKEDKDFRRHLAKEVENGRCYSGEPVLVQRGGHAILHVRVGRHACKV